MYEPDTIYSPEVLHDGFSQSTLRLLFVVQGNILHSNGQHIQKDQEHKSIAATMIMDISLEGVQTPHTV